MLNDNNRHTKKALICHDQIFRWRSEQERGQRTVFYENGNKKLNRKKSFQNTGLDRKREGESEKTFSFAPYLMS